MWMYFKITDFKVEFVSKKYSILTLKGKTMSYYSHIDATC